jgi:hypothetical protein
VIQGIALTLQGQGLKDDSKQLSMASACWREDEPGNCSGKLLSSQEIAVWGGSTKGGVILGRTVGPKKCEHQSQDMDFKFETTHGQY